jgi:hypothetical protein
MRWWAGAEQVQIFCVTSGMFLYAVKFPRHLAELLTSPPPSPPKMNGSSFWRDQNHSKVLQCSLAEKLHSSKSTLFFTIYGPSFKGTVPQDFRLQVFLISFPQSPPLVPYMMFSKPREDTTHQFTNDTSSKLMKSIIDTGGKWITGFIDTDDHQYQQ